MIAATSWYLNAGLLVALGCLAMLSLAIGPVPITLEDLFRLYLSTAPFPDDELFQQYTIILEEIRLPRLTLALLVGASLGLSGAALQGLLRNPLAEPGLLGVTSSASLGAVLSLYFGLTVFSSWLLPLSAMSCAAVATLILYFIARSNASALTLILSGVALSSLAAALTALALNLAPNPTDVQDIVLWLLGSLNDRSFNDIQLCFPFVLIGSLLLLASGPNLNTLTLGEEEAISLGVDIRLLRMQIIVGTSLCVGATVAVTGSIGFVGLVVPHILRRFVNYHPSKLLLSSAIGGAILLLAADIVLRLISDTEEIMLGVVTALIGAPFFFILVLKYRGRES